jgi:hypothetical protein
VRNIIIINPSELNLALLFLNQILLHGQAVQEHEEQQAMELNGGTALIWDGGVKDRTVGF